MFEYDSVGTGRLAVSVRAAVRGKDYVGARTVGVRAWAEAGAGMAAPLPHRHSGGHRINAGQVSAGVPGEGGSHGQVRASCCPGSDHTHIHTPF